MKIFIFIKIPVILRITCLQCPWVSGGKDGLHERKVFLLIIKVLPLFRKPIWPCKFNFWLGSQWHPDHWVLTLQLPETHYFKPQLLKYNEWKYIFLQFGLCGDEIFSMSIFEDIVSIFTSCTYLVYIVSTIQVPVIPGKLPVPMYSFLMQKVGKLTVNKSVFQSLPPFQSS